MDKLFRDLKRLKILGEEISFHARVMRTPPLGTGIGVTSEPVMIHSKAELDAFLSQAGQGWQWKMRDTEKLSQTYDSKFFQDHVLIAGVIGLSSGSVQIGVTRVTHTEDKIFVDFHLTYPQFGTCDMMSWHYFVEVSAEDAAGRTPVSSIKPTSSGPDMGRGRISSLA